MVLNLTATEVETRQATARRREREIFARLLEPIIDAVYNLVKENMQHVSHRASDPKPTIYIAGPMSGYAEFNFPAFFAAQKKFESEGYEVFNPANKDSEKAVETDESFKDGNDQKLMASGWDFRETYLWDCEKVIYADAIYMLKGWEKSAGARGEHAVAISIQQRYPEYKIIYE